jgi:methionyl-tRNA synthetase
MAKDILWFHAVIWEALLLAAGLELPKIVFAHGFFTVDGQKMSKSLGNVITPKQLADKYGVEGARYLIISACSFGSDGDISLKSFDTKYNADLANGLGNLVSRTAKLCENSGFEFAPTKVGLDKNIENPLEEYKFDVALKTIWEEVTQTDQFINEEEPWTLKGEELKKVLIHLIDHLRSIAFNLRPFLPETAEKIERQFAEAKIKSEAPLFPRLS